MCIITGPPVHVLVEALLHVPPISLILNLSVGIVLKQLPLLLPFLLLPLLLLFPEILAQLQLLGFTLLVKKFLLVF